MTVNKAGFITVFHYFKLTVIMRLSRFFFPIKKQNIPHLKPDASSQMSLVMRKPAFCICENKDADQLCGNRKADQRLCFRCTDSTIPPLPKCTISSL